MTGYTVVDLESTGLAPRQGDRIIEIAMVFVDPSGRIEGSWSSLVDPGRDVGPVATHGISARDVAGAPTFTDIAPLVVEALRNRTLVAHNARFDVGFLTAELERAGLLEAGRSIPAVCTMEWADRFLGDGPRTLPDCCAAAGIELPDAHSALGDATATARLLAHYLDAATELPWSATTTAAAAVDWPEAPVTDVVPRTRDGAVDTTPGSWIDALPSTDAPLDAVAADGYRAVLARASSDAADLDVDALASSARNLGLARAHVVALHDQHLATIAAAALRDGAPTRRARRRLEQLAIALGRPATSADDALQHAAAAADADAGSVTDDTVTTDTSGLTLVPGDRVAFTDDVDTPRDLWEELVVAAGLTTGEITEETRLVVAGDPEAQTVACQAATTHDIPVITEGAFEPLLRAVAEGSTTVERAPDASVTHVVGSGEHAADAASTSTTPNRIVA